MDNNQSSVNGTYGGKTAGSVTGGLYIYLCSLLTPDGHLKEVAIYLAPFVAVYSKEIGGAIIFELRAGVISQARRYKLNKLKRNIDKLPDHPGSDAVKKEVFQKFYELHSEILLSEIEDIKRMGKISEASQTAASKDNDE